MRFDTVKDIHIALDGPISQQEYSAILQSFPYRRDTKVWHSYAGEAMLPRGCYHFVVKQTIDAERRHIREALVPMLKERIRLEHAQEYCRGSRIYEEDVTMYALQMLQRIWKEVRCCFVDGCFAPTWDQQFSAQLGPMLPTQKEHVFSLAIFDRHGEDLHPVHRYCEAHMPYRRAVRHMMTTLQVTPLTTPDVQYWDKVVSWETRGHFYYAQRLTMIRDGEYETGYFDSEEASEWYGPYESRSEAIDAARNA